GLLDTDPPSEEDIVVAMHAFLARTPCRLLLASPYDVVGEIRQPNLPGTVDEYPNWRLPLPLTLEQLQHDPRVARVITTLRTPRTHPDMSTYRGERVPENPDMSP